MKAIKYGDDYITVKGHVLVATTPDEEGNMLASVEEGHFGSGTVVDYDDRGERGIIPWATWAGSEIGMPIL